MFAWSQQSRILSLQFTFPSGLTEKFVWPTGADFWRVAFDTRTKPKRDDLDSLAERRQLKLKLGANRIHISFDTYTNTKTAGTTIRQLIGGPPGGFCGSWHGVGEQGPLEVVSDQACATRFERSSDGYSHPQVKLAEFPKTREFFGAGCSDEGQAASLSPSPEILEPVAVKTCARLNLPRAPVRWVEYKSQYLRSGRWIEVPWHIYCVDPARERR